MTRPGEGDSDHMDQARSSAGHPVGGPERLLDAGGAQQLASRLRTPLTPVVGLVEVFLRRWGDELSPAQIGLLRTVDREGRRVLATLDAVMHAVDRPDRDPCTRHPSHGHEATIEGSPGDGPAHAPSPHEAGGAACPPVSLEGLVPMTVAELLRADGAERMLASLRALVEACGGRVDEAERHALGAIRTLPDAMRVPAGRELTLGPVVRALSAAAVESASGDLAPPRRSAPHSQVASGEQRETLVAFDLGTLGAVRAEFGDPGARWLVDKLRRTLRSLLREQDRALRYPASRFLVVLANTSADQARRFERRLAWEWNAYLGHRLRVCTQVEPIENGDLTATLRRLSFGV